MNGQPPGLLAAAAERLRGKPGRPRKATAATVAAPTTTPAELPPRLLDVDGAARYLSISVWTVRDLHATGRLPRVRLPLGGDRECRRLLFDVRDIDKLIETSRETA